MQRDLSIVLFVFVVLKRAEAGMDWQIRLYNKDPTDIVRIVAQDMNCFHLHDLDPDHGWQHVPYNAVKTFEMETKHSWFTSCMLRNLVVTHQAKIYLQNLPSNGSPAWQCKLYLQTRDRKNQCLLTNHYYGHAWPGCSHVKTRVDCSNPEKPFAELIVIK